MDSLRSGIRAFLVVLTSVMILLGSFTASLAESGMTWEKLFPAPTITETGGVLPLSSSTPQPGISTAVENPPQPQPTSTPARLVLATPTRDLSAICNVPPGWKQIVVTPDDTLDGLALMYGVDIQTLMKGNCLLGTTLLEGTLLYVPVPTPTPVPTSTAVPEVPPAPSPTQVPVQSTATESAGCQYPTGWIPYVVKSGDNLYRIGLAYGVSAGFLQSANCLSSPDKIYAGQVIYVPNVPTRTPVPGITQTQPPTALLPTNTSRPATSTATFSPSVTPTPTATPSATPSWTPSVTPSPTPSFTPSSTPTFTPTMTMLPTDTATPEPTLAPGPTEEPPGG